MRWWDWIWVPAWVIVMGLLKLLVPPLGRRVDAWWYGRNQAPA